jgi:hypothetical protein
MGGLKVFSGSGESWVVVSADQRNSRENITSLITIEVKR